MGAAKAASQKSLARLEARDAAAKAAAKREEERVVELKRIRGERWLRSIAKEMQLERQGQINKVWCFHSCMTLWSTHESCIIILRIPVCFSFPFMFGSGDYRHHLLSEHLLVLKLTFPFMFQINVILRIFAASIHGSFHNHVRPKASKKLNHENEWVVCPIMGKYKCWLKTLEWNRNWRNWFPSKL